MSDLPHNAIRFPKRNIRLVYDCQGERQPYAAKLTDQLSRTNLGLDAGMSAADIREHDAKQCEARINYEAERLKHLRTPQQAAMFVSRLAIRMNNEAES